MHQWRQKRRARFVRGRNKKQNKSKGFSAGGDPTILRAEHEKPLTQQLQHQLLRWWDILWKDASRSLQWEDLLHVGATALQHHCCSYLSLKIATFPILNKNSTYIDYCVQKISAERSKGQPTTAHPSSPSDALRRATLSSMLCNTSVVLYIARIGPVISAWSSNTRPTTLEV